MKEIEKSRMEKLIAGGSGTICFFAPMVATGLTILGGPVFAYNASSGIIKACWNS